LPDHIIVILLDNAEKNFKRVMLWWFEEAWDWDCNCL